MNVNRRKTITKTCVLIAVLLLASCVQITTATSPISETDEAGYFILDKLSYTNDDVLIYVWGPVSEGDHIIATKEPIFDVPCPGYVAYIDLHPSANLFHPVQYVFLSDATKELLVFDAMSPPQNFNEYSLVQTTYGKFFLSVENRRAHIPDGSLPAPSKDPQDSRWAVLMNGGYDQGNNHVRYWNDLSNIYIALVTVYGFPDENIIVLCSDGLSPAVDQSNGQNSNPDMDGDGDEDIMYSCVLSNVDSVFTSLANNLTMDDKLFVFTTDHGDTKGGQNSVENLWNHEELTDAHFAELLDVFPDCEIICTFEPCFSGGFLDNVVVPPGPIIASSACAYNEYSYASSNLEYDEYVFHWTAAVKGEDAYGVEVNADINEDGIVTMDEAYVYAKAHDVQNEHPQYGEYPENIGANISLWISNLPPDTPTKPNGPDEGITGGEYTFSTSTTDPESQDVYYQFNWSDGNVSYWVGPYSSGVTITQTHTWMEGGTYSVQVKAMDVRGGESGWSDSHEISIVAVPLLEIQKIKAKAGRLNVTVKNIGTVNVTDLTWNITLKGGLILLGKKS
jgi:hypothetical protein